MNGVKGVKFLLRLLNAGCILASFQTTPPPPPPKYGWQPVTHSARSRRSNGKIGDCEQSIQDREKRFFTQAFDFQFNVNGECYIHNRELLK